MGNRGTNWHSIIVFCLAFSVGALLAETVVMDWILGA